MGSLRTEMRTTLLMVCSILLALPRAVPADSLGGSHSSGVVTCSGSPTVAAQKWDTLLHRSACRVYQDLVSAAELFCNPSSAFLKFNL